MTLWTRICAAAVAGMLATGAAVAQDAWPTEKDRINIVVPFGTGGSADRLGRHIASGLSEHMNGAPVTVVNKPGASGAVGSAWFLRQPDDGSHFMVTHIVPYLANNILTTDLPMEWADFDPLNVQWQQDSLLFAHKDSGYETLPQLIEAIRDKPGEVSAAILQGSGSYMALLLMLDKIGIPRDNVRWVTFQGGGNQRSAVAGGNVTFTLTAARGSLGIADNITPLAIHNPDGNPDWPGVPYLNDVLEAEYGVTVPALGNTQAGVVAHATFKEKHPDRYEAFLNGYRAMLESEAYKASAAESGLGADWMGPEATKTLVNEGFETMKSFNEAAAK